MRTALLLACLLSIGCDADLPTAPSTAAPQTVAPAATQTAAPSAHVDVCEAIRSGRIKTFLPVAGC